MTQGQVTAKSAMRKGERSRVEEKDLTQFGASGFFVCGETREFKLKKAEKQQN